MARPPDDFNNLPTQDANFGAGDRPPSGAGPPPDGWQDLSGEDTEPTAWYRRPVVLVGWGLLVVVLIVLIVYGIGELLGGSQGTSPVPSTTRTTSPTTTTTTAPTTTTTQSSEPSPSSSAVEPPAQQPTQQPTQQQPSHRHHLPQLPPVITIPGVPTITVPPGLR